jgi:hypothetical protein
MRRVRKRHVVKFDPRDPIIVKAMRIVDPPEHLRDAFRRDVMTARYALVEAEERRALDPRRKDVKEAVGALGAALRRVVAASKNENIPPELAVNPVALIRLTDLASKCEEVARAKHEDRVQAPADTRRLAVQLADPMLEKYGPSTMRLVTLSELAGVLVRVESGDMLSACRQHLRIKRTTRVR